jgi:hypothetical protein
MYTPKMKNEKGLSGFLQILA